MAGSTDVVVKFLADVSDLAGGVKSIDGKMGGLQKTMRRVGGVIGAVFAVKEIGTFVTAAEEANVANARLEQTMRKAGDATGEWAKHAESLADSLQRQTGIDDEVIKGGQAILSTFHNVSDAAGQQSGIFDRATKAALDLSKTGFGDVDSAAKALGKALQDPEKGLTALTKSGITFTDQQKEQIKGFIEAGDQASAMNIILGEVENQVGGVAEKTATSGDKMRASWNETKEALGNALLPVLTALAPKVEELSKFVQENATWLVPLAIGIAAVVIALKAWIGAQTILNGLLASFGIELAVPTALVFGVAAAILVAYAAVVLLYVKWDAVWSAIGNMPWYAKTAIAIAILTNPILLLIVAVAALAVYWNEIWGFIAKVINTVGQIIKIVIDQIINAVQTLGDFFSPVLSPLLQILKDIVTFAGKAYDAFGKLKGVAGSGLLTGGIPIPGLANGGIVTRPTLAMIGERGPEAVVPLSHGAGSRGAMNVTINVNAGGLGADAPAIQSAVVAALRQYTARNGPLPAAIVGA